MHWCISSVRTYSRRAEHDRACKPTLPDSFASWSTAAPCPTFPCEARSRPPPIYSRPLSGRSGAISDHRYPAPQQANPQFPVPGQSFSPPRGRKQRHESCPTEGWRESTEHSPRRSRPAEAQHAYPHYSERPDALRGGACGIQVLDGRDDVEVLRVKTIELTYTPPSDTTAEPKQFLPAQ